MTSSRRFDPTGIWAAVGLALLLAAANAVWIFLDFKAPEWDQAHYLAVTLEYRQALTVEGIGGLLHAIHTIDPGHGPLLTVVLLPFVGVFGDSPRSGMLLNVVAAPVMYLAAGQIAWIVFRDWVARLLAIFLVATMPIMVGLYHNVLQDFLLVTLAVVSVLLLLLSDEFRHRWYSLALGATIGLGSLTKVTFPIFIAGPLIVVLVQVVRSALRETHEQGRAAKLRPILVNALLALAVYLAIALPWYVVNFDATLEYVRSTTTGPLSEGVGPTHPLRPGPMARFTLKMVSEYLSWIIALVGAVALYFSRDRLSALLRRPRDPDRLLEIALLVSWFLVPYLFLVTAHNQDVRLMAAGIPAAAILVAASIASVRQTRARAALIAITALALTYVTVNHVVQLTSPEQRTLSIGIGSYEARTPVDSGRFGYEKLPEDDYGTPLMEYLERASARPSDPGPKLICALESEPLVNTNTLRYLALARDDDFGFSDVFMGAGGRRELAQQLSECDFALFVRQTADAQDDRVTLVNEGYAATFMTPRLLESFPGPRRVLPVAKAMPADGLTEEGRSATVTVLSR